MHHGGAPLSRSVRSFPSELCGAAIKKVDCLAHSVADLPAAHSAHYRGLVAAILSHARPALGARVRPKELDDIGQEHVIPGPGGGGPSGIHLAHPCFFHYINI